MTITLTTAATITSLLLMLMLALKDPKRLRAIKSTVTPSSRSLRWTQTLALLSPGIAMLVLEQWLMFILWCGLCCCGGWLMALWLSKSPRLETKKQTINIRDEENSI